MKTPRSIPALVAAAFVSLVALLGGCSRGGHDHAHDHGPGAAETPKDPAAAAWLAAAVAQYPLKTCVVSGGELGSMGTPYDHIHREEGKPDRLVRFCCESCIDDFTAAPARFLAQIDAAAAKAPATP